MSNINPLEAIVWICIVVFAATALLTLLHISGLYRLPDPDHGSTLFKVLVLEVVAIAVSAFAHFVVDPPADNPELPSSLVKRSEVFTAYCPHGDPVQVQGCLQPDAGYDLLPSSARVIVEYRRDKGAVPHDRSTARLIEGSTDSHRACMEVECYPVTAKGAEVGAYLSVRQQLVQ